MDQIKLLIASQNVHKIRELREMFKSLKGFDIYSLLDFPKYEPPEETGETFEENALLKAVHAAEHLDMIVVVDDSGLVVPALNGKPGVRSRRYAGDDATDQENNQKLLKEMNGFEEYKRAASYECCIALAAPGGFKKTFRGVCEGTILEAPKGSKGFGYDPLFQKHDQSKSFGELDESIKTRVSHRRKAFDKLSIFLASPAFHALVSDEVPD